MSTIDNILNYIKSYGKARASDLYSEFGLSRTMVHKHLAKLVENGYLIKQGKPPTVFYSYSHSTKISKQIEIDKSKYDFLDKNYMYVSPSGEILYGLSGFTAWVAKTKQEKNLSNLVDEYIKNKKEIDKHKNILGVIDATKKLHTTFKNCYLDKVFYSDFYSIPKFGKTKLGQKVLYAKQAQIKRLMQEVVSDVKPDVEKLISKFKIDAVSFVPATIPRNIQFLKEFEKKLNLPIPTLKLKKAYVGEIPVAQKTLSKLDERVENARRTIFIQDQKIKYKNILIIDDAVGSGSTLNETANKIKFLSPETSVYGYSIVGSLKGFEIINEV